MGFDILWKLSPKTICMKCQSLFSAKKLETYFEMLSAEIISQHAKHKGISDRRKDV